MSVVHLTRRGSNAVLTIDRQQALNTITLEVLGEIEKHLDTIETDDSRAVILTGAGRAFCAGTDLNEWKGDPTARMVRVHALIDRIMHFPKISIAAVNGFALGGGLEFALACTFRVARASAKLGLPEIKLGLVPAYTGTQLLPRLIGTARALEMMLHGDPVDTATALSMGLVNRVSPDAEDVVDAACAMADSMTRHSRMATAAMRRAVTEGLELPLDEAFALERVILRDLCTTEDAVEGVRAFLEKRPAVWKDR